MRRRRARGVAAIRAAEVAFDVILSDVDMAPMSGPELHAALLAERPALARRFVFFTGGTGQGLPAGVLVLEKPLSEKVLNDALLELMETGGESLPRFSCPPP